MTCTTLDLTLEGVLIDPMVAAVMRADRIDPRGFEDLLRSAARKINGTRRAKEFPCSLAAERLRVTGSGSTSRW